MVRPHNATATAVVVLGDDETIRRCGQLTARAALRSATVAAMFAFTTGAPESHDDLSEVDHALRREVQAVDALDRAALASAGVESLERVVEHAVGQAPPGRQGLRALAGRRLRRDSRGGRAGVELVGSTHP
jgi:hypothetical protein